jgi:hypothetical protein
VLQAGQWLLRATRLLLLEAGWWRVRRDMVSKLCLLGHAWGGTPRGATRSPHQVCATCREGILGPCARQGGGGGHLQAYIGEGKGAGTEEGKRSPYLLGETV